MQSTTNSIHSFLTFHDEKTVELTKHQIPSFFVQLFSVSYMKNEQKKVDFNLSILKLDELIKVYGDINNFIKYLNDKKIVIDEKESD